MTEYTPNLNLELPAFDKRQWHDAINKNLRVLDALWAKYFATSGLVGVWNNATAYNSTDLVVDEDDGTIWRCNVSHTSPTSGTFAASRLANPTYWSNYTIGVRYKGAWSAGSDYAVGDFVVSGAQFAVANEAHTAGTSFATDVSDAKWDVLIDGNILIASVASQATLAASYATTAQAAASVAVAAGNYYAGTMGGGATNFSVSGSSYTGFVDGMTIAVKFPVAIGANADLNVDSLGAKPLYDEAGVALAADAAAANTIHAFRYNSSIASGVWQKLGKVVTIAGYSYQSANTTVGTGAKLLMDCVTSTKTVTVSTAFTAVGQFFSLKKAGTYGLSVAFGTGYRLNTPDGSFATGTHTISGLYPGEAQFDYAGNISGSNNNVFMGNY